MVSKKAPFACRGGTACLACSNGTKLEGNTLQTEHWEEICGDLLSAAVCCVYPLCFQLPVVFKALTFFPQTYPRTAANKSYNSCIS